MVSLKVAMQVLQPSRDFIMSAFMRELDMTMAIDFNWEVMV